jgi:DNA repair exonuclease SbcCD ATPase subunit
MAKVSEILNALDQEHQQAQDRIQQLQQELDQQLTNLRQSLLVSVSSADCDIRRDMESFCSQLQNRISQLNPAMTEILDQRMGVYRKAIEQALATESENIQQQSRVLQIATLMQAKKAFRLGLTILGAVAVLTMIAIGIMGWMLNQIITIQDFPYQNRDGLTYMQVIQDQGGKSISFKDPETGKYWIAVQTQADSPANPDKASQ